jgi:signal transduction histidine kinase
MAYWASLVIYLAVFIRVLAFSTEQPLQGPLIELLGIFGIVLVTEMVISRRFRWYPAIYLIIQSGLAITAFLIPPRFDFLPTLFIPVVMRAVSVYGYPVGYYWISLFGVSLIYPMLITWNGEIEGYVMIALFFGLYLLTGNYANQIRKVELSRQENERILQELQKAHRQLQEYAGQIEDHAAAKTRSHMAQELHDSVTQTIFTVNLAAQTAGLLIKQDPVQATQQIDRMVQLAGNASEEITSLVSKFRPRSVVNGGLPAAISRLASERQTRDGLEISLDLQSKKELPESIAIGLYRITQEALNNVSKHSGNKTVIIRLNLKTNPFFLEVIDHGRGFDLTADPDHSGHLGLAGISSRADEIGWKLMVDTAPGKGTRIRLEEIKL